MAQPSEKHSEVVVFCQTHAIKSPHIIWSVNGQLTQGHVVGDEWSFTPHTSSDVPVANLTTWHTAVTGTVRFNKSSATVSVGCGQKLYNKELIWAKEPITMSGKVYYHAWLSISRSIK